MALPLFLLVFIGNIFLEFHVSNNVQYYQMLYECLMSTDMYAKLINK